MNSLSSEEWEFIKEGKIIQAISSVKNRLNTSLTDAKKLVDKAREVNCPPPTGRNLIAILEEILHGTDKMELHIRAADTDQMDRFRRAIRENIAAALKLIRGFI